MAEMAVALLPVTPLAYLQAAARRAGPGQQALPDG